MSNIFNVLYDLIMGAIDSLGVYGPLLGCFFIILESIIPALPLFVFITINFVAFDTLFAFIISWVCTCLGCLLSYFLVKKFFRNWIVSKTKNSNLIMKCMSYFENLSLAKITIILAIPFTPAFMMNIAAGLTNMNFKKFLAAILISKLFLVYFWGIVGTSLLESLENPESIITVIVMVVLAYLISLITKKVFKID